MTKEKGNASALPFFVHNITSINFSKLSQYLITQIIFAIKKIYRIR